MRAPILTEDELRDLVSRDEGQFLEFKSTWDQRGDTPKQVRRRAVRDTIAESVAAFANADGGLLLIGVEDDGNGFPYRVGDHVTREPQEVISERRQVYRRVGYEQRFRTKARAGAPATSPSRPWTCPGIVRNEPGIVRTFDAIGRPEPSPGSRVNAS